MQAAAPDVVVVATGAPGRARTSPARERPLVRTLPELAGWVHDAGALDPGAGVVVLGGGKVGLSLAALA